MICIDRIENNIAVCETDSGNANIPLSEISGNPKSGDILILVNGEYHINVTATIKRKKDLFEKQRNIF